MSFVLSKSVRALKLPLHHKAVLSVLADHADEDNLCWPSHQKVADQCDRSRRTVVRIVKNLVDSGLVEIMQQGGTSENFSSNTYRICEENFSEFKMPTRAKRIVNRDAVRSIARQKKDLAVSQARKKRGLKEVEINEQPREMIAHHKEKILTEKTIMGSSSPINITKKYEKSLKAIDDFIEDCNEQFDEEYDKNTQILDISKKNTLNESRPCPVVTNVSGSGSTHITQIDNMNKSMNRKKIYIKKDFSKEELDKNFTEFWDIYPRKQAKGAAKKKYEQIIKQKLGTHEEIMQGLRAQLPGYLEKAKTERHFIPFPSTWLNQIRWQDCVERKESWRW